MTLLKACQDRFRTAAAADDAEAMVVENNTFHAIIGAMAHSAFLLPSFNKLLIDKYLDIPYVETKCGYACSDQYVPHLRDAWIRTDTEKRLMEQGGLPCYFHNRYVPQLVYNTTPCI